MALFGFIKLATIFKVVEIVEGAVCGVGTVRGAELFLWGAERDSSWMELKRCGGRLHVWSFSGRRSVRLCLEHRRSVLFNECFMLNLSTALWTVCKKKSLKKM